MKFIDSPKKRLTWYSRNYFYVTTIAVGTSTWLFEYGNKSVIWERSFDFAHIWRCFLNNFGHGTR